METLKGKTVSFIGLGLMGGALAMGIRKQGPDKICAFDINEEVLEDALRKEVIDWGVSETEGIRQILGVSDLVVICLYPQLALDFILEYMEDFKENAVITDITGVKKLLVDHLRGVLREDLDLILGHPMAGSEKEGFGNADDSIFKNRNYILVPQPENKPENLAFIKEIIHNLGFVNIVETTAEVHDQKIAFTSQLCHVIASALVDSEDDLHITDYEGGSFGDLTRIAMINAGMWTELFICNKEALVDQIEKFEKSMDTMKKMIQAEDSQGLTEILSNVRKKRITMEVDRQNKTSAKTQKA
ncbi:MAG: Cyclohexadienyl dehydrogenase [Eubacterium sp.]|uniref:Prephenate dehydrogenase n=1 Tax=Eubacterium maltosivorans TaxID=2041044 RepID=A0A4P9CC05_EUBML|nr:prephenate dehydrogenase [Eubacterium maltosivorans]QCT72391.1 prephenate dehydrogenase [Eubacterium maltosivorans]